MDTDDEEEEIESETEEDRVFIDDDVEEQGSSFYRALDREHEDQSENDHECAYDRPVDNSPEPKEKKVHPLEKLQDRFQEYLQELPVLGFNSSKYDLNFCFLSWSRMKAFSLLSSVTTISCALRPHIFASSTLPTFLLPVSATTNF